MKKLQLDAAMIWINEPRRKNHHVVFRKSFNLKTMVETAETYIEVDTKYWLYVNGQRVVFEGGLFRESVPGCGYADKVDIGPYLRVGKNVIAIHVHYYGNEGRNNTDSGHGGLVFECDALEVRSDHTFKCMTHPAYYMTGGDEPSYLYGGDNLGFDANKDIPDIYDLDYTDDGWHQAVELDSNPETYERPIPLIRQEPLTKCNQMVLTDNVCRIRLPYAMQLNPCFQISAEKNTVIDIRTDRYTIPGGPGDDHNAYNGHRIEYICKEGSNSFESDLYLFGEELILQADRPVTVEWIGYKESGYDTEITGHYNSSCSILNRLVEKSARTLYVCMRDNFMDCPDRERGQWIGDVSSQAPQVFFLLDDSAKALLKKSIRDFINLRKGDVLVGNVPGANYSELPAQSLNAISELGLIANYYKYTGDKEVLELALEPCIRYLSLWEMGENGLVIHRDGDWDWCDHLYNIDKPVLENAWYYSALKFTRFMSEVLKDHRYDALIEERMTLIEQNFNRLFWQGECYASGQLIDDRANALAVLSGLCDTRHYSKLRKILVSVCNASIYMEYHVLSALCEMGYYEDAYKRMISRYYHLANNENSTLWEDFNILGTKNHAWSGTPATIAFKYFLGIDTDDGFTTYTVEPVEGLFDYQKARLTINGERISLYSPTHSLT